MASTSNCCVDIFGFGEVIKTRKVNTLVKNTTKGKNITVCAQLIFTFNHFWGNVWVPNSVLGLFVFAKPQNVCCLLSMKPYQSLLKPPGHDRGQVLAQDPVLWTRYKHIVGFDIIVQHTGLVVKKTDCF